jgi:predicted aspartyl protease
LRLRADGGYPARGGRLTGNAVRNAILIGLVALLAACAPPVQPDSAEACRVERITAVPLIPPDPPRTTRWAVEVALDGKAATMMLDSGASGVVIDRDAATRLGLRQRPDMQATSYGLGGVVYRRVFEADSIGIGTQTTRTPTLIVEMTAAQEAGRGFDGIVGMGAFEHNDIEIDFPARTLTLYRARFCPSGAPPWSGPQVALRRADSSRHSRTNLPMVTVELDGQQAHALLDTGATASAVDAVFARSAGAPAEPPGGARRGVARTMSETSVQMWQHRFGQMRIGEVRLDNPLLWLIDLGMTADMILGLDVLSRMRIWMSNSSDAVYIAPAAGAPARP